MRSPPVGIATTEISTSAPGAESPSVTIVVRAGGSVGKYLVKTSFRPGKSATLRSDTVTLATLPSAECPFSIAAMLSSVRAACALMSPLTAPSAAAPTVPPT